MTRGIALVWRPSGRLAGALVTHIERSSASRCCTATGVRSG
jgi:hypothetical protein